MSDQLLNILLWICQALLSLTLLWAAIMKLVMPRMRLEKMWPWVAEMPAGLIKGLGIIDLAGAVGLVLPMVLDMFPGLVPITSICVVLLMISAIVFHVRRGEASAIGINIVFSVLAVFIILGRW